MEIQGIQLSNLPSGAHVNLMQEVSTRLGALIAADIVEKPGAPRARYIEYKV